MKDLRKLVTASFIILSPMLVAVFYGYILFTDPYCFHTLYGEEKFIENATVFLFILAGLFSLWNAIRWRGQEGRWHWFYLGFGVLLILVAMEEMSWGQHILGTASPDFFLEHNVQQETNLHNIVLPQLGYVFYVPLLIYGVLLPPLTNTRPIAALRRWGLLEVPSVLLSPAFAFGSLIVLRVLSYGDTRVMSEGAEVAEMILALCLAMAMVMHWRKLYQGEPDDEGYNERREFAIWTGVALLGVAAMAGGALVSVTRHCNPAGGWYGDLTNVITEQTDTTDVIIFIGDPEEAATVLDEQTRLGGSFYVLPDDHTTETLDRILSTYRQISVIYFNVEDPDTGDLIESTLFQRTYPLGDSWYSDVWTPRYLVASTTDVDQFTPAEARFGEHISLQSYVREPTGSLAPGDALGIALAWQANATPESSYKVFVHVYNAEGAVLAQQDSFPMQGRSLTTTWVAGQTIVDRYGIILPNDIAPGTYDMAIGMYDAVTNERVPVTLPDGSVADRFYLPPLNVH
jgi:hypothetical protein